MIASNILRLFKCDSIKKPRTSNISLAITRRTINIFIRIIFLVGEIFTARPSIILHISTRQCKLLVKVVKHYRVRIENTPDIVRKLRDCESHLNLLPFHWDFGKHRAYIYYYIIYIRHIDISKQLVLLQRNKKPLD